MTKARDNGYRCYLLGGTDAEVAAAASAVTKLFRGWQLAGFSCGYFQQHQEPDIVNGIRSSGADLLLVGMGTPEQELFVQRNASVLQVPLIICVGGLFSYWNRRLNMAPRIVRRFNLEWLWILSQQPHKWRRYTIGVMQFLVYIVKGKLK
jgi:N-acetylglucosaminyldiphosphoundecaprenol N-acetyl-beta-D-mannosaminyltransferase